jgi:hypothetical protein
MVERNEQSASVSNPHLLLSKVWAEAVKEHRKWWRGEKLIIKPSTIDADWVGKVAWDFKVARNLPRFLPRKEIAEKVEQYRHEATNSLNTSQTFEDKVVEVSKQLKTRWKQLKPDARSQAPLSACSKLFWFAWPEAGFPNNIKAIQNAILTFPKGHSRTCLKTRIERDADY